jgi:hypothetical protein
MAKRKVFVSGPPLLLSLVSFALVRCFRPSEGLSDVLSLITKLLLARRATRGDLTRIYGHVIIRKSGSMGSIDEEETQRW